MYKVIKDSFKSACHWRLFDYFLGSGGSLIAILLFYKNIFNKSVGESVLLVVFIFVCIFIARFLFFLFNNCAHYIHNAYVDSIWGNAIDILKDLYGHIHFLTRKDFGNEEFMIIISQVCDTIGHLMSSIIDCKCAVSIIVRIVSEDDLLSMKFKLLSYDKAHDYRLKGQEGAGTFSVAGNTAFSRIVNMILSSNPRPFYINNNVHTSKDYDNTRKCIYEGDVLPYKSELVFPIIPLKSSGKKNELFGFIWIECEKENAFKEDSYSISMMQGIADGIVDVFRIWEDNNKA